jgi:hypothetical protein
MPLKLITMRSINQPKLYKLFLTQKLSALSMPWHTDSYTVFQYLEEIYQDCTLTVSLWNAWCDTRGFFYENLLILASKGNI